MLCAGDTRSGGNQDLHDACQVNPVPQRSGSSSVSLVGAGECTGEGVMLGFKIRASEKKMIKIKTPQI